MRTCQGCREPQPGRTVEPIGHVCPECDQVLLELATIRGDELKEQLRGLQHANATLADILACFREECAT